MDQLTLARPDAPEAVIICDENFPHGLETKQDYVTL